VTADLTINAYRILDKIGEGGMGAVYLAEHTLLGRRAAIKVLLPSFSADQAIARRFFNEARAGACLSRASG
jgi:serine/threonine protein kinase